MNARAPDRERPAGGPLLGREAEVGRLEAALAAAREGRGAAVAVEGPAGIGKTRLLEHAVQAADAAGLRVLRAAGSELERDFAFGVARHLFEGLVVGADPALRAALLDGPAALAAPVLGLPGAAATSGHRDADEARQAAVHGLWWLAANVAGDTGLLLVVDDLQAADEPSLRFLAYLARRLPAVPVVLLVAIRPPLPDGARTPVEALLAVPDVAVLAPEPLAAGAVVTLAAATLGAEPSEGFVAACLASTGGNPLLVREVLVELARRGAAPDDAGARAIGAVGPDRIARGVQRRLAELPAGASGLAAAVAVLGEGCALDVAGELARLGADDAVAAAAALAGADVLADGLPLRFRHPLVGAAVREGLPAFERAAAHARAARLLAARGAPSAVLATHLVPAPPVGDDWTVERLCEAAAEARDQGSPDIAARLLERAFAEPPGPHRRLDVLRAWGSAGLVAGDADAPARLHEVLEGLTTPLERAELAVELASGLYDRFRTAEAAEVARRARADLPPDDADLALRLEILASECARMDLRVGGDDVERLRARVAGLAGATPIERSAQAWVALMDGNDTAAAHAAAARAIAAALAEGAPRVGLPETGIVSSLVRAGELDEAARVTEAELRRARERGLLRGVALMTGMRGWIALDRGRLRAAEADLVAAEEVGAEVSLPNHAFAGLLALVLAWQGRADEARAHLTEHGLDGELPTHQVMNVTLAVRARVRTLCGQFDEALADALEVGRRYGRFGLVRAVPPWRSQAAVLLAGRGDGAEAERLAVEELELAHRWGTPTAVGVAERALGLVRGDVGLLAQAVATLERSPARLELAAARLELGAALRRAKRRAESRGPLEQAMDAAHACGATLLVERALVELRAAGARPRRHALSGVASLTASELRVAELAAAGRTNRAIAQELFVTAGTVETHLRHVFQKLDLRSRAELPGALADA